MGRPGLAAAGFEVADLGAARTALADADLGQVVEVEARPVCRGTSPGGTAFELWEAD